MAGKEKRHTGSGQAAKQPRRLGAAGEPVPRLGAAPARGRRACTSRLRNRGVTGQAQTVGLPVHTKTGVTAARLSPERTEPGNRVLAPPARAARPKHTKAAATSGC